MIRIIQIQEYQDARKSTKERRKLVINQFSRTFVVVF